MYFVSNKNGDSVEISVKNKEGNKVFATKQSAEYGFNVFEWDLVIDTDRDGNKSYIQKGEYTIEYKVGRSIHITSFNVK
jgi:flagellar hook assembly protein FlgD